MQIRASTIRRPSRSALSIVATAVSARRKHTPLVSLPSARPAPDLPSALCPDRRRITGHRSRPEARTAHALEARLVGWPASRGI